MFSACLVADLPCILDPLRLVACFQRHYIKTQVSELALTLLHPPQLCTPRNTALLVGGNAFKCTAMPVVAALPNLHHHGGVTLCHDQIEFATAAPVILGNKHKPF